MRHGKKFNHLSRKKAHRKAMLTNMAISLIEHKRINTTLAKAKALRQFIEPLITRARKTTTEEKIKDATHHRRIVFSYLQNKEAVKTLFGEIAMKIADRPGGYVRILRTGFRENDAAEMCILQLVEAEVSTTPAKKSAAVEEAPVEAVVETPAEETAE